MTDSNNTEKGKIIRTQDENGDIFEFELVDVIEVNGKEYGLLIYLNHEKSEKNEESEEEIVIMRLSKEDEGYVFETIEEDNEFQSIVSFLESEEEEEG